MLQLFNVNERQEGEICTRGRCTAMGYLFDKEKTLDTFDDEGWLHQVYLSTAYLQRIYSVSTVSTCQGDLGRVDGDGFYSVVGRIKEIIITAGGENIAPVNIEEEVSTQQGAGGG